MVGWDAEDGTSESGKCAQKVYNNKVRGQSEVERSTFTREKPTHRQINDGRGVRGDWL